MTKIIGKQFEYTYENGDSYRVSLTEETATWTALTGSAAGSTGTESYDWAEVAPNAYMVSWLEATAEVVTFVLNLNDLEIFCSYVYGSERHFLRGKINLIS